MNKKIILYTLAHVLAYTSVEGMQKEESRTLSQSSQGETLLHRAAGTGNLTLTLRLINAGVNLDLVDGRGRTPLNVAARFGHVSTVNELLKAGADVHLADDDGCTPLFAVAELSGNRDIVEMLLQAGADPRKANKEGRMPLNAAHCNGYAEIVQILISRLRQIKADEGNRE